LFAARVFGAPLTVSLPNPSRSCDYTNRSLRGSYPTSIYPGINGLHLGKHRLAPQPLHLLNSIRTIVIILLKAAESCSNNNGTLFGLACLAPLALGANIALQCRSSVHCFEMRLLRIDALRLCSKYQEASSELSSLLDGKYSKRRCEQCSCNYR